MTNWSNTPRSECWEGKAIAQNLTESGKALWCRVRLECGEYRSVCIPVDAIHGDSEVWKPGHKGLLVIPASLAIRKRLM